MEDQELTEKQIEELRIKKLKEIDLRFADSKELTTEEYLSRLRNILKCATLMLERRLVNSIMKDSLALINIAERVHWLIDSVDKKHPPKEQWITEWKKYEEPTSVERQEAN